MADLSATTKIETLMITVCWTEFHINIHGSFICHNKNRNSHDYGLLDRVSYKVLIWAIKQK